MFLVDTEEGRIITDEEIKGRMATAHPYREWLEEHMVELEELPGPDEGPTPASGTRTPGLTATRRRWPAAPAS